MLISTFTSKAENLYISSQLYHSSGIYFEPILKIRLFSENYNFISYSDILPQENLQYKMINVSHKKFVDIVCLQISQITVIYIITTLSLNL